MTIVIPRGFPMYAFFPEWVTVFVWFFSIAAYAFTIYGWRKQWLTLSYRS